MTALTYTVLGYISGSVLYARVFSELFGKQNMLEKSRDKNPGTANAFKYCGFLCGILTLIFDISKGFLPVFLFTSHCKDLQGLSLVMAAPVIGHAFPLFFRFKGGKAIAVTFGCLLGLLPTWQPAAALALFFIFFSLILKITPHFHRTLIAYFCSLLCMTCITERLSIPLGFLIITVSVCARMLASPEQRERIKVGFLWMH